MERTKKRKENKTKLSLNWLQRGLGDRIEPVKNDEKH